MAGKACQVADSSEALLPLPGFSFLFLPFRQPPRCHYPWKTGQGPRCSQVIGRRGCHPIVKQGPLLCLQAGKQLSDMEK